MLTKGKLIMLGIVSMVLFGLFTRTLEICIPLTIFLFSGYILYKYFTKNNDYNKKVSVAQDFLSHKYGEKMGKYILKESTNKINRKYKNYSFMIACLLTFILFLNVITISVSAWDSDNLDFDDYANNVKSGSLDYGEWSLVGTNNMVKTHSVNGSVKSGRVYDTGTFFLNTSYEDGVFVNSVSLFVDFKAQTPYDTWNYWHFYLYDQDSVNFYHMKFYSTYLSAQSWNVYLEIYDANGSIEVISKSFFGISYGNDFHEWNITISRNGVWSHGDRFRTIIKTEGDTILDCNHSSKIWDGNSEYVTQIKYSVGNIGSAWIDSYLQDVKIEQTGYVGAGETNLYFEIYDLESGEQLDVYGHGFIGAPYPPYIRTRIYSDLWEGDYNPYMACGTITLSNLNLPYEGSWHWFNFTTINGYADNKCKTYQNSTNYLMVYPTQTFTIYITDVVSPYGDWSNCRITVLAGLTSELCTDKAFYTQGESINFRYKAPTEQQLYNVWWLPSSHYYLWIYDVNNLHWLYGTTDGGVSAENWDYIETYAISLDNIYHTLTWHYNATGESGYKTVTGGRDTYKAYLGHGGSQLFGMDAILVGKLQFYITSGVFTPHGNITSVSPSEPELGQRAQITFDVNNNGYMTSRNLLSPDETELTITSFAKFIGSSHVNYTFWDYGEYLLTLYVSDGLEYTSVDTKTVSVTTLNDTYGGFGYNVEFLTVEPARAIAGFDMIYINYRSLSADGFILVNDSRGQQTPFSTFLGVKTGVLTIQLPNYAEIGEWNVTLFGNGTLYSNFQVVAEENNWVEFAKNIFYTDEIFMIELKHDRKIEVVFYKDDVAYGRDWFLESGLLSSGIFDVPIDIAFPEEGEWKVEIWQVNNFIKIQKLAEDTCRVIERPPDYKIEVSDDVTDYLSNIDPFYKGLIGIFIVLLCTFLPLVAVRKLGEHGVNFKVDIPPMLYTICCGVGSIVALILGVWVIEYTFFICVMAGFGTFALYLMGKHNNGD